MDSAQIHSGSCDRLIARTESEKRKRVTHSAMDMP